MDSPLGAGSRRWGPDGRRAAVVLTFDNLGEAAEIEQGVWPEDRPVGAHPSVTDGLPHLLGVLDELRLRGTFFVEGINARVYPGAVSSIAERGHEVAYHAWRHESWGALGPEEERGLLERGVKAMAGIGVTLEGFRPPGGGLTGSTLALLGEFGLKHCSPLGETAGVEGGVAVLPFGWEQVDAYYYYPPFDGLRESHGDTGEPLPPSLLRERMLSALAAVARDGGFLCTLFHPFLLVEKEHREAMRDVLEEVGRLDRAGAVWCAPCREVADYSLPRNAR